MTRNEIRDVNLLEPSLYRSGMPYELYDEVRGGGPVRWHPETYVPSFDADIGFWAVLGHREVQQANRDWETFSAFDGPTIVPFEEERRGVMLVSKDPPEHSRMRRLISAGFTPRMIAQLEEKIRARTDRVLDDAAALGDLDFVADVAYLIPMHVIADIIGIPEDDRPEVFRLTDALLRSMDPMHDIPADERLQVEMDIYECARELNAAKRANPDRRRVVDPGDRRPRRLRTRPVLPDPHHRRQRDDPQRVGAGADGAARPPRPARAPAQRPVAAPTATEEILRWSSPVISFGRTATRDTELGGQQLRAGDRIGLFYPSANRDGAAFVDPYRFDIARSPNPHVAFGGGGPHYCLGASLARTEIQVMMGELLRRFDTIEITGAPVWLSSGPAINVGVAVQSLPVRLA